MLVLLLSTHLVSSQCWILIYTFAVLIHRWVRNPWREPNILYVYEPQQNLGRGLWPCLTDLSPPVIHYWLLQGGASVVSCSICQYSSAFGLFLTFYSFYLGYPARHLLGKSCRLGFPLVLFLFYATFIVYVPFPFWCLGEDAKLDCIASWLLPFHLLHNNI